MAATRRDHRPHMNEALRRDPRDTQRLIYDNPVKCILTAKFNSSRLQPLNRAIQLEEIVRSLAGMSCDLFFHFYRISTFLKHIEDKTQKRVLPSVLP